MSRGLGASCKGVIREDRREGGRSVSSSVLTSVVAQPRVSRSVKSVQSVTTQKRREILDSKQTKAKKVLLAARNLKGIYTEHVKKG